MHVTVELSGLARELAENRRVSLDLPRGATYKQVVEALAAAHPRLVGLVIDHQGSLLNSNILSRSGEDVILPEQMDSGPHDGERLLLLSVIVGG